MADEQTPQISEEERIARKAKLFRMISYVLIVFLVITVIVFIIFFRGGQENVAMQTTLDTQPLRSKLKQIISLENRYYDENGEYVSFGYLQLCEELGNYDPDISGNFKFKFDAESGIATGMEKDASHDVNEDFDGNDGLTLSTDWEAGVIEGSQGGDFFWPEEDLADFEQRKSQ